MKNKGVIHCDVKPENILFVDDKFRDVKLIDFGSSCENYKLGFSYVQSRMYRAPEIVFECPYDHAIDIWSVGCILFEIVNNTPLFPAQDQNELLEFFMITLGDIPLNLFKKGQNFQQFYHWSHSRQEYVLKRCKTSTLGSGPLKAESQTISSILGENVNPLLLDLIEQCIKYNPKERITAEQALQHKYFQ